MYEQIVYHEMLCIVGTIGHRFSIVRIEKKRKEKKTHTRKKNE